MELKVDKQLKLYKLQCAFCITTVPVNKKSALNWLQVSKAKASINVHGFFY